MTHLPLTVIVVRNGVAISLLNENNNNLAANKFLIGIMHGILYYLVNKLGPGSINRSGNPNRKVSIHAMNHCYKLILL